MYYPYFRGKQYDLITVRDLAPLLAANKFCPIIEPVKENLSGLQRTLDAVLENEGQAIVIVNPQHGDLSEAGEPLTLLLREQFLNKPGISAGILLKEDMTLDEALDCYRTHEDHSPVPIHAGFGEARSFAQSIGRFTKEEPQVFFEKQSGKLYQRHYEGAFRVLLRDGFVRRKTNREYPPLEAFSDLHATYPGEGMDGFGDFLIVGSEFADSGGPAYAIAIHLTFIDPDRDDEMWIHHFVSDRQDTPKDPAGKFAEALSKLIAIVDSPGSKILKTTAIAEFRDFHDRGHFPGLGYVKKLSMTHHIETLADYLDNQSR